MTEESKVMEFGTHVGQVIKFFNRKGFGFIRDLNEDKDYFVWNEDIITKGNAYRKLYPGEYVSYNLGKKEDDGRDKCVGVRGVMGYSLLTENPDHNYRVFPKYNSRSRDEDTPRYDESSGSDNDPELEEEVDEGEVKGEEVKDEGEEVKEEKEIINKEAPEGIEVAEFDGLNTNEEMG